MTKKEDNTALKVKKSIYEKDFGKLIELGLELNNLFIEYCDDSNSNEIKGKAFASFFQNIKFGILNQFLL